MPNSFSGRPRQEDAQVFLRFVMHQMHDELLELEGEGCNFNGGKVSLVSFVSDEDDDDSWETVGPKNKTAITRTQSVKCVMKARDPVHTIEDALHLFSAPETLQGYRAPSAGKGGPIVILGLCLPKALQPLLPIYLQGLISRFAELREQDAQGLGELIGVTSEKSLKEFVIPITGRLIPMANDDDSSFKSFHLLNALSDLLMLPKDMLLDSTIRKEVCSSFGVALIKGILDSFVPDEFCPDAIPEVVLEALDSEILWKGGEDCVSSVPCVAGSVVYDPPSASSIIKSILVRGEGVAVCKKHLGRTGSSVLRMSNTSDDELDDLSSPFIVINIIDASSAPTTPTPSPTPRWRLNDGSIWYQLLKEDGKPHNSLKKEEVISVLSILRSIKSYQNVVDTNMSKNPYAVCDLCFSITKHLAQKQQDIQDPILAHVPLPLLLYQPLEKIQDKKEQGKEKEEKETKE
ncbi:hypothetical protein Lser_V15G42923 [Lactuca serriola]